MAHSIVIIEDDKNVQEYLREILLEAGYSVQAATDGIGGLNVIKKTQPDLVILDLGLPNVTGEAVCLEIRKKYPDLPIIILTAKSDISDVVSGLNLGADDYVTKPFVGDILLARIKARLRRSEGRDATLKVADLELDTVTLEVKRGARKLTLTPKEFELLKYLISNKGRILTREMILNRIWLYSPDVETRVVDVYMGYLRKKVDGESPKKLIHSVRGFGYTIKEK